jgi:CHASE2 domain-containing sensor protein
MNREPSFVDDLGEAVRNAVDASLKKAEPDAISDKLAADLLPALRQANAKAAAYEKLLRTMASTGVAGEHNQRRAEALLQCKTLHGFAPAGLNRKQRRAEAARNRKGNQ